MAIRFYQFIIYIDKFLNIYLKDLYYIYKQTVEHLQDIRVRHPWQALSKPLLSVEAADI